MAGEPARARGGVAAVAAERAGVARAAEGVEADERRGIAARLVAAHGLAAAAGSAERLADTAHGAGGVGVAVRRGGTARAGGEAEDQEGSGSPAERPPHCVGCLPVVVDADQPPTLLRWATFHPDNTDVKLEDERELAVFLLGRLQLQWFLLVLT